MQMLASCPRQTGFTLLELMVVLGLVSVVSALAFPGLLRLYESVARTAELKEIVVSINSLGRESFESNKPRKLTGDDLQLPDGWRLHLPKPIYYSAKGVCQGGTIDIIKDDTLQHQELLTPPYCQIRHE